jgi:hypothetical protein
LKVVLLVNKDRKEGEELGSKEGGVEVDEAFPVMSKGKFSRFFIPLLSK